MDSLNISTKTLIVSRLYSREASGGAKEYLTIRQFLLASLGAIIMGKLTQATLLSILKTMIQDEDFLESLAKCIRKIFDIAPQNLGTNDPFEIVVDRIMKYFEIHTEIQKVEIPGIRSTLIEMFKEKQFLAFARNLMILGNSLDYTDARIFNYLKCLKFRTGIDGESISPWIDVTTTAEAVIQELNPERMSIFARLTLEERCLLQGFTSEQIAVMSKFSPKGIVMLPKLGHLPPNQRSMILGMDRDESRLFQNFGFDKIRLFSSDKIFGLGEEQDTLKKLIEREAVVIQSMTGEAGTLAEGIHDLTVEERGEYSNLSPREVDTLNELSNDYREVVLSFRSLNEFLNVAKNLHTSQRDLILSLRKEEIDALLGDTYDEDLDQIQKMLHYSPTMILRLCPLMAAEQDAILELTQQQRLVLADAYDLGHDGLFMIRQLGPELTGQVLSGKKELNVMQTGLKKKLANVDFDESSLSELFEIIGHDSQAILLDLSARGIQFLSETADLNGEMIDIVKRLSDNGMTSLLNNDRLTGTEILMLGNLDTSEGNVLFNLDIHQRHYLSDQPDLTKSPPGLFKQRQLANLKTLSNEGELVLKRIVLLSDDEHLVLKGLHEVNTALLTIRHPQELNLLASFTFEKLDVLSSFLFWGFGENLMFKFFRIPIDVSYGDKIMQTRRILQGIGRPESPVNDLYYIPLIAGAIEVLRLNGVVNDNYVEEVVSLLEGPTRTTTLSLLFKVNLLKFSLRDSASLVPQLISQIGGSEVDITTISRFNLIETIEDLMFIRWILSSSSTMDKKELFEIGRGSLIHLSYHLDDGLELGALLSESTSRLDAIEHNTISRNFKRMFSADQHLLSTFLFFAVGSESNSYKAGLQVTKIFIEYFDANECFQFLNTPASNVFLNWIRHHGLQDIRSDARFSNPTILEVCLYHNRGSVFALTEKLDGGRLWKLLEHRPLLLLRLMTRFVRTDLIKMFAKAAEIRHVWEENHVEVFQSLMGELTGRAADLSPAKYLYIARGIRRLTHWPSFLGTDTYVTMVSEYIKSVQRRVSESMLRNILNSFVSEDVSREFLISAVERRLGDELVVSLRDRSRSSCNIARKKRGASVLCVDSENTEELTSKAKKRIVQSTFDDEQSTLYDELLDYSERKFQGEELDPEVKRELMARIKDIPLDPRIKDIVSTLDNPREFDTILKQSGMLNKIERVASTTGFVFTMFFVGKHIAHGDIEGLGYDALNLLILPKIGEKITEALEKSNPVVGSLLGTTVGNFAAFSGLVSSIIDRKNAVSEVDKGEADLNIVTNAAFIAANLPAVATRILGEFGIEFAVLGEFGGPVGVALTVPVVIGSYLIGVGLEVGKVTDHIQLSFWEKLSLYWDIFRDHPVPEKFVIDVQAKNMYADYIVKHLRPLNGSYDKIALSLPSFLINESECDCIECTVGYENTTFEMEFSHRVRARYPFSASHQHSRIIPENIEGYDFVCGPSTKDAMEKIIPGNRSDGCPVWSRQLKELSLPSEPDDDCQNIVSFIKRGSLNPSRAFFYIASDASIELSHGNSLDIVFHGRNISITDGKITEPHISVNKYYFEEQPDGCSIHKRGHNSFYVVGETFECDLGDGTEEQYNTVVIKSDFNDSSGINSIVGSELREKITANFAEFVDGSGGGDVIRAMRNTIVKGYANDLITGDCTVILPFNVSGIARLVARTRITIFSQDGSWIEVDGNARIMTADYYLLTPIRTSNITHRMVRAHIRKNSYHRISIEEELPVLRTLTIPNCKLVKQITSANYDIVLSDSGHNVFTMDKTGHEYFWEAAHRPGNLYILRKMSTKVMISNASGILDFQELKINPIFDTVNYHWSPEGGFGITIGGLHVSLLPEYDKVKITFDGRKYFKLGKSGMCRDWCSHSLPIVGKVFIDATDLHNYYNCFDFNSDKIFFSKLENDLLLVSGKQILTISKYYSHLHGEIELSLKLKDGKIIEAPEFRERADHAHKVIHYEVGNSELQIYHNQPVDRHHIGYVDLGHQSIKDVGMTTDSGSLLLLYRNSTLVRIENWDNYSPARDMVFAFKDSFLPNAECIFSDCDPEDIIVEFKRSVTSGANRGSSWINFIINPIRNYYATLFLPGTGSSKAPNEFNTDGCIISNVNLVLVLLQSFLNRISPRPKLRNITTVETLANVIDLTQEYDHDPFQLYCDIVELVRIERYDLIPETLNSLSRKYQYRWE